MQHTNVETSLALTHINYEEYANILMIDNTFLFVVFSYAAFIALFPYFFFTSYTFSPFSFPTQLW